MIVTSSDATLFIGSDIAIPAIVALLVSGIASFVTYMTTDRRAKYDAAFEAAKYREKWISELREEIALLTSQAFLVAIASGKNKEAVQSIFLSRTRLLLAVPKSNPHYEDFSEALAGVVERMMETPSADDFGTHAGKLTFVSKKILKAEWDDVQALLANGIQKDKRKKKNAKNQ